MNCTVCTCSSNIVTNEPNVQFKVPVVVFDTKETAQTEPEPVDISKQIKEPTTQVNYTVRYTSKGQTIYSK